MALLDAITQFVNAFNNGEKNIGALTLLPERKSVSSEVLLNGAIRFFYETVDVGNVTIGNEFLLDIASLTKLPRYQEGWGVVYHTDPAGTVDTERWHPSWLIFGFRNADAVFTKLQDEKSPVFGSIEKAKEFQLATSLESFLLIMAAGMTMVRDEFHYDTQLEDCTVKPEVIERTQEIVAQYEDPAIVEQFIAFFFE